MDLKIRDIVELLGLPEKTVLKMIQEDKIPAYKMGHQYRFSKAEINEWILANKIVTTDKILDMNLSQRPVELADLLKKGGIHYGVAGTSVGEVIRNAIAAIPTSNEISKTDIVASLLEREELMSTAIGRGIAFPHPRVPIISGIDDESIALCLLANDVDYKAIDGTPVHSLFVILSASPKRHLEILAKVSFLCQREDFRVLLRDKADEEKILGYIADIEKTWK